MSLQIQNSFNGSVRNPNRGEQIAYLHLPYSFILRYEDKILFYNRYEDLSVEIDRAIKKNMKFEIWVTDKKTNTQYRYIPRK